jgi:hypothetical protein
MYLAKKSKDQLPYEVQSKIRERAVRHFFPTDNLKPLNPGSVLYTDRKGLVAYVTTAGNSGRNDIKFWYGLRKNHLESITKARQAFFVACGFIDDNRLYYFSFPCSAYNRGASGLGASICDRPLLSESKEHFNVELTSCDGVFQLDIYDGQPMDATPFATRQSLVAS